MSVELSERERRSSAVNDGNERRGFDYVEAAHVDYRNALERMHSLSDALQEDFKMLSVALPLLTGAVAALSGATEFAGITLQRPAPGDLSFGFWAFTGLATVVAIIGFRDYARALAFEHQLYTVVRHERLLLRISRKQAQPASDALITPGIYFVEKFLPKLTKIAAASSVVFALPTMVGPVVVLALTRGRHEALLMLGYSGVLALAYAIVGQRVLGRFTDLFESLSPSSLATDDPDSPL